MKRIAKPCGFANVPIGFLTRASLSSTTARSGRRRAPCWRRKKLGGRIEEHPGDFFAHLPDQLRETAKSLAAFRGGAGDDYVFVDNATAGCNAVLTNLPFTT